MADDTAAFVLTFGPSGGDHAAYVPLPASVLPPHVGTFRVRFGEGLCRVGPAPKRRRVKRQAPVGPSSATR